MLSELLLRFTILLITNLAITSVLGLNLHSLKVIMWVRCTVELLMLETLNKQIGCQTSRDMRQRLPQTCSNVEIFRTTRRTTPCIRCIA